LEKLLKKMDEYIRADNDFLQRRDEAYRYSEITRGFRGRLYPRHVRTIDNPNTSDDITNLTQSSQHSSQSLGMQQTSYRPPAPRGRGRRSFGGRYGNQPGNCSAYSVAKTRDTPQGRAKSISRSRRKSLELKHGRTSQSRLAYCFMLLSVYSGVCGQPTAYDLHCFSKSFPSFLGSVATTTTTTSSCPESQSTARRASSGLATA
jgi:hypothetical protein